MNPLKQLMLNLSRMPPALMLLIIIGLAVIVTMMVSGTVTDSSNTSSNGQVAVGTTTQDATTNGPTRTAVCARSYIPAGSTIESKQLEERKCDELQVWEDTVSSTSEVVGRRAKQAIPEKAQIRQIDLE